jgi:hypothetical protein
MHYQIMVDFVSSPPKCSPSTMLAVGGIFYLSLADDTHTSDSEGEGCMGEKAESGEGLKHVVQIGPDKDKTYLHDSEMPEALPQEMVVAEELDEVVTSFEELDLEIVELPEAAEDVPETAIELLNASQAEDGSEREAEVDDYSKDDPVLLYLREMGAVPLLRPEEEVDIAQRTEQAAEEVQRLLLKRPKHRTTPRPHSVGRRRCSVRPNAPAADRSHWPVARANRPNEGGRRAVQALNAECPH